MFRRHPVRDRQGDQLEIRSDRHGDVHVVELAGELDMHSAAAFDAELGRAERSDAREIVVDLSRLRFISAEGLKAVIHATARSREHGNRLRLLRAAGQVQQTFETAGLVSRLPFDSNRAREVVAHRRPPQARLVVSLPVRNWPAVDESRPPRSPPPGHRRWAASLGRRRRSRSGPRRG